MSSFDNLINITTGKLNSNAASDDGKYPFFTCSPTTLAIDTYAFDCEAILLAGNNADGNFPIKYYKGKFNAYQRTYVLTIKNVNILSYNFLYYYLKTQLEDLKNTSYGSATKFLTLPILQAISIPKLGIDEQKAIAAVLSSLDDKIGLLHRQNATLEAMAEALFRQWFVVEAKDEWEKGVLPDEFDFTMGQSPPGESFNESGQGIPMFQGNADFGFRFPLERVYTTSPTRFAEPYDTLISVRAPVGAQNMALIKCCIGRGLAAFRYRKNPDYFTYTYYKIRSLLSSILLFDDEGTVFGSISKDDFCKLKILIPSENAINDFEKNVSPLNHKVILNCLQIRTLEKLRDTLLPKLMSGEVRVDF